MFSVFLCLHFSQFMYAGYWGVYVVLVVSSAIDDMTLHCLLSELHYNVFLRASIL